MGHSLHLITIEADSPKDACSEVESQIEEWGNENGWSICGCVSEDDEVYVEDDSGGWMGDSQPLTIPNIAKMIKDWAHTFNYAGVIKDIIIKFMMEDSSLTSQDWWTFKEYCEYRGDRTDFDSAKFDIWESEYRSWMLNKYGLTNMISGQHTEGMEKYVVFIDMHS